MPSLIERAVQLHGLDRVRELLSEDELAELKWIWRAWARPNQLPPVGDWLIWLMLTGRGFGKTRAGAEFIRAEVESGRARRIALVARTPADGRDIMIEGESGILSVCPPHDRPNYEPTKRRLTWPNGAIATMYTSWEPDMLRGPQHDLAWCDELASFKYPRETWDNLMFGLRLGLHPRCVVTTTPRPISVLKEIMAAETSKIVRGSTHENLKNLAPSFREQIIARYEGTSIGRQELYGEVLDEIPGAIFKRSWITVKDPPKDSEGHPDFVKLVIAVDPASGTSEDSDETGIVAAAVGADGHGYVIEDVSARVTPDLWARRAVAAYHRLKADKILGESNFGGEMVRLTIQTADRNVPVKLVTASRGKRVRAEPVAALYEQGRVFHTKEFPQLTDQMCTWTPESGISPDRLDALVWALTELLVGNTSTFEQAIRF